MSRPVLIGMQIGYDAKFLGLDVSLPDTSAPATVLHYPHFTVGFRLDRRLAAVSALNIHGALLRDIERRQDVWILDPRVPAAE